MTIDYIHVEGENLSLDESNQFGFNKEIFDGLFYFRKDDDGLVNAVLKNKKGESLKLLHQMFPRKIRFVGTVDKEDLRLYVDILNEKLTMRKSTDS